LPEFRSGPAGRHSPHRFLFVSFTSVRHRFSKYIKAIAFLGDILVLNFLFVVLYFTGHFIVDIIWTDSSWSTFLLVLNVSWLAIIFYTNPYQLSRIEGFVNIVRSVSYTVFQHFLITCTMIYLLNFTLVHKWGPIVVYSAFLFFVLIWRLSFFVFLRIYRAKGYNFRNVVIVGQGNIAGQLRNFFDTHPEYGFHFLGFFSDDAAGHSIGKINDLPDYISSQKIDEIYCCLPYIKYGQVKKIVDLGEANLIRVKLITDFRAFSSKGLELERYDHIPVLNVSSVPLDDRKNQLLKRGFDVIFSLLLITLVFSWLFPILAILIKFDSKGPVFFRQRRTGRDNTIFYCLKFRTMKVNEHADAVQASQNDSRITRFGNFLRKSSLDELPQFLNVLGGSMSVVGPRPHMLKHTEEYSQLIGKFMARHFVKPGVTGLAQSRGYRGETKEIQQMKNRVTLDRFYIENWSFLLDVKIILQTVFELIRGNEKAY
jgi:putative colanic acid biosynthesis UDP-glucose lipid carrier transferase